MIALQEDPVSEGPCEAPKPRIRTPVLDLAPDHFRVLDKAMSKFISSELAFETYAQIIDGAPLASAYRDWINMCRADFDENIESSLEAREMTRALQQNFDVRTLLVDARVAQAYQNALVHSLEFNLRLLEIVAVLCHEIAVQLFISTDGGLHKPDPELINQHLQRNPTLMRLQPMKTELYHSHYLAWEQYPDGVADIVGYFAEFRFFGGVVLFDRGDSGTECRDAFIHPNMKYKIYQLSSAQIEWFINFVQSDVPSADVRTAKQQFKAERSARRIDPYDAMGWNIYRDRYERKIGGVRHVSCVRRMEDEPGLKDAYRVFIEKLAAKGETTMVPPAHITDRLAAMMSCSDLDEQATRPLAVATPPTLDHPHQSDSLPGPQLRARQLSEDASSTAKETGEQNH